MVEAASTGMIATGRPAGFGRRLVAAVVAVALAFVIVAASLVGLTITGHVPLNRLEGWVAEAVQEQLGRNWTISVSRAGLTRREGQSTLLADELVLRHRSGFSLRAPEGAFSYDPLALLRGRLQLSGVDLKGLSLSLAVDASGAVEIRSEESAVRVPTTGDLAVATPLALAMALTDEIFAEEGALSWLRAARIREASLVLIGPDGQRKTSLSQIEMQFQSINDSARRVAFSAQGARDRKHGTLTVEATGSVGRVVRAELRDIDPGDILPLAIGSGAFATTGLKGTVQITATRPQQSGAAITAEGAFTFGAGTLSSPRFGIEPMAVDAIVVRVDSDGGTRLTRVKQAKLMAGSTQMSATGVIHRLVSPDWRAELELSGQVRGEETDPPAVIDRMQAVLQGDGESGVKVEQMRVAGPRTEFEGSAWLRQLADGPSLTAELRVLKPSDLRTLVALWPTFVSPQVRAIIAERIDLGLVRTMDLKVALDPAAYRAAQTGAVIPDEAVRVNITGQGVRFKIGPGFPLIADAEASVLATGSTLAVQTTRAKAEVGRGLSLALSEGQFTIADTYAPRAEGRANGRMSGSLDALLAMLAMPGLKDYAPAQINPQGIKGQVDLKASITLPMASDVKAHEVIVVAQGPITQVSSDAVLAPEKLENGQFTLNYDRGALTVRGDMRLTGQPTQVDVRQNPRGQGEAIVTTALDQAARQRRGLGFDGKLTGPVPVKITKTLTREGDGPIRIEADLTRAAIDGLLPGWSKPAGRSGRLSFIYEADKDGVELNDFLLDSAPVLLRGTVSLGTNQELESASLTSLRLSPGDDLRGEIRREGNLHRATIRGAVLDVRPFLKNSADTASGKREPDLDLDLSVPILTGHGSEQITNATLKLQRRDGEARMISFDGRIGRAPISIKSGSSSRQITVQAADGGGFLRFLDYYKRAYGGDLTMSITPSGKAQQGTVLYRDFTVRNEPALRRVLAETQGGVSTGDRPQSGGANRNAGSEVAFTKMRGDFTRTGSRFDLRELVIWGPLVGFTAQGNVDYGRDRIDLAGTFIPSYAFNNAFSQVPVFGRLLGGGQYEGLFAVNFRLTGAASNPSLNVNPLSAIAPGILRRFVDPFGGGAGLTTPGAVP